MIIEAEREASQQTAVEWLIDYIKNLEKYPYKTIQELEIQAKEMEKEQINNACYHGYYMEEMYDTRNYYNTTYKKD